LEANKEGYPCLLSGGAPDSRRSGADLLPILAQATVAAPGQLAHRTQSGAHGTVRCLLPTVAAATCHTRIARPTIGADNRWLTGQSGAPPDSPVNYSRPAVRQETLASCQAADRPPLCREHRRWFVLSDWHPKKVSIYFLATPLGTTHLDLSKQPSMASSRDSSEVSSSNIIEPT
jgi:hypothetical protein